MQDQQPQHLDTRAQNRLPCIPDSLVCWEHREIQPQKDQQLYRWDENHLLRLHNRQRFQIRSYRWGKTGSLTSWSHKRDTHPVKERGPLPMPPHRHSSTPPRANWPAQIQIQRSAPDKNESKTDKTLNIDRLTVVNQNKPSVLGSWLGFLRILEKPPNVMPSPWRPKRLSGRLNH